MGTCKECRWKSSKRVFASGVHYKCILEKLASSNGMNFHHHEDFSCEDFEKQEPEVTGKVEYKIGSSGEEEYTCTACKATINKYWLAWSDRCPCCDIRLR